VVRGSRVVIGVRLLPWRSSSGAARGWARWMDGGGRLWKYEECLANSFMSMSSQKSTAAEAAAARRPQRERGRLRVAALMKAASLVFAERGYEAATMTEIAARAGASIGSLYQFFPSKEVLADALLAQYGEQVVAGLGAIAEGAAALAAPDLADALIDLLVGLKDERSAALVLIEARRDAMAPPSELRDAMRRAIARILTLRAPGLPPQRAAAMAVAVLQQMKAAAALSAEPDLEPRAEALAELRRMTRLYLAAGLTPPA